MWGSLSAPRFLSRLQVRPGLLVDCGGGEGNRPNDCAARFSLHHPLPHCIPHLLSCSSAARAFPSAFRAGRAAVPERLRGRGGQAPQSRVRSPRVFSLRERLPEVLPKGLYASPHSPSTENSSRPSRRYTYLDVRTGAPANRLAPALGASSFTCAGAAIKTQRGSRQALH